MKSRLYTREELERELADAVIARANIPLLEAALIAEKDGLLCDPNEPLPEPTKGGRVRTETPYGTIISN